MISYYIITHLPRVVSYTEIIMHIRTIEKTGQLLNGKGKASNKEINLLWYLTDIQLFNTLSHVGINPKTG